MKLKAILQKLRLSLGKELIDTDKSKGSEVALPNKILFLRQDGKIGDYTVSSFVFRELKKQNNDIKIGIVCTKQDAYLYQQNPHIDHIYYVKKRNIIDYIRCGLKLRKEHYDVVIDPTVVIKNRDLLLLRLINAKNYIGYKKSDYGLFNINIEGEHHFSTLYKIALEKLGVIVQDTTYDVPYDENIKREIEGYLQENNLSHYVAINFYGAARAKKVSDENIPKYIEYLQKITNNQPLVLLSYPEVASKLQEIAANYENVFVHNTTKIFHTIELIRNAELLISTDTSTVHIASGFDKKIIGIYRDDPIAFIHWKPMSKAETHILFYKENINEISPEQIKAEWVGELKNGISKP